MGERGRTEQKEVTFKTQKELVGCRKRGVLSYWISWVTPDLLMTDPHQIHTGHLERTLSHWVKRAMCVKFPQALLVINLFKKTSFRTSPFLKTFPWHLKLQSNPASSLNFILCLKHCWWFLSFLSHFMCMDAYQWICVLHVCSTFECQKRVSEPLKLELQTAVINLMGAGNWTLVFWKGSWSS